MNNIGVILAAGTGSRFQSKIPKYFVKLNGKMVTDYSIDNMLQSNLFFKILIMVSNKKYYSHKDPRVEVVEITSNSRNETIYKAIEHIKKYEHKYCPKNVLFQDAARPLITVQDFIKYIQSLNTYDACITEEPISDALFKFKQEVTRSDYSHVQTPEAFRYKVLIEKSHKFHNEKQYNSIVAQLEIDTFDKVILSQSNLKITTPKDLFIAEQLLKYTPYIKTEPVAMKKALVFGGHGGIGKEVCKQLRKRGCEVIAPTHEQHDLTRTTLQWDWLQQFDVIINCVGLATKDEDGLLLPFNTVMRTNVLGSLNILNALNQRPSESRKNVVLVSSSAATRGRQGLTLYSASKAALHSITESLSGELKEKNTYINIICPEKVNTAMAKRLHGTINTKETLTPSEVARAIISYCRTDEAGSIVHIRKGMKC